MCGCKHNNIDGFDNSIGSFVQNIADKVTTVKNNTIQNIKNAPGKLINGFVGGNAGDSSFVPDFGTAPVVQPINYTPAPQPGLSGGAIAGLAIGGIVFLGLVTAVVIKVMRKK